MEINETKTIKKMREESYLNEQQLIGLIWENPIRYFSNNEKLNCHYLFNFDKWGFFYEIGYQLYKKGNQFFDEQSILEHIKGNEKLEIDYELFGGYETIVQSKEESRKNYALLYDCVKNINKVLMTYKVYKVIGDKVFEDNHKHYFNSSTASEIREYWLENITNETTVENRKLESALIDLKYETITENLFVSANDFFRHSKKRSKF